MTTSTPLPGLRAGLSTLALAHSFAARGRMWVVLGDSDQPSPYWVATPADAARLERAGYELA